MKCKHCGEELIEDELYDLGYGQRGVNYECPNNCDYIQWELKKMLLSENELAEIREWVKLQSPEVAKIVKRLLEEVEELKTQGAELYGENLKLKGTVKDWYYVELTDGNFELRSWKIPGYVIATFYDDDFLKKLGVPKK